MTNNTAQPAVNTMHTTVYSHDGYKLNIVLAIDTVADIAAALDEIRANGLTPNLPGLEPGQEKESIMAVVRRASKKGTPVIDFYAHWQYEGKFGAHKYAHMYLDTPEQIAEFEAQSGLRLANLPLYEGQTAIQREYGKPTRFETEVKQSFEIVRTPDGQHDTGMAKYIYSYAAPAPMTTAPQTPPQRPAATPKTGAAGDKGAGAGKTAQTDLDAPFFADWWTDGAQVTYVKEIIGTPPGLALGKMGRTFNDFATPDDMIAAYRAHTEGVMNASAVTHDTTDQHIDDPLRGEMLDITRVEPRIHRGRTQRYQWIGYARFEGQPITVLIFKEDAAAIREAGYDTSGWDTPDGRTYREGGIAMTTMRTETGRQVAAVWNISEQKLVATERAS